MKTDLPMRLALRIEGNKWNAYVCKSDTMDGAIWIGSIAIKLVEDCPRRKNAFIELMTDAIGDVLKELYGKKPIWKEQAAPEHERTKE